MAKRVMVIPASLRQFTSEPINTKNKRKTAGYARVSTDSEEQATSYEAQMEYYQEYIISREGWEFVGMYSDEGITATNTKHREGFNLMIEDALDGKIDLIITKSVSRFARNTVDSLTTVRKLKERGVEIYFEKENIWTLDAKGELLITIMSSLAQEESRSISENTTWGQRKRFADGRASVAYKNFLGYDKGFKINEEEAETVRLIYKWFLEGYSSFAIARKLTDKGVLTPMRKEKWHASVITNILKNEKYKGDALLQKHYTTDFLTKKLKKNEGEVRQYYVEGHHKAIISPAVFELVQAEFLRRNNSSSKHSGVSIFSSKIKCGDCDSWFGSKIWHSNDKYRKVIFQCNNKFKGKCKCTSPHLSEQQIKDIFVSAFNKLMPNKNEIIDNMDIIIQTICDNKSFEEQARGLEDEIAILVQMTQDLISRNAHVALNQEEYQKRYEGMIEKYETKKGEYDDLQTKINKRNAKAEILRRYTSCLTEQNDTIIEFDGSLWSGLVDCVTAYSKEDIRVTFKDGMEITV